MGFKEDFQRLSLQVNERKVHITNEEMTKQALIIPFVQVLGFDVFNPLEVRPEYVADFGKKKGEKVDYALFKDGIPVAFIEAKTVNENLDNHDAQLSRYFNAVPEVKLGILTNGIIYKFFTDLTANNMMDDEPFLVVNMEELRNSDIENLSKFKKDSFDKEFLVKYAEELVYTSTLDDNLRDLLKNPNDEFIRFLIKDLGNTRVTTNVIERFRPIVKKAISNAVLDIVSKGLYQQEDAATKEPDKEQEKQKELKENIDNVINNDNKHKVIDTTTEELSVFEMVKEILKKSGRDVQNVIYKDTTEYFSINYQIVTKWFFRINLNSNLKNITTRIDLDTAETLANGFKVDQAPKGRGESRIYIDSYEDIKKLDKLIIACYDDVIKI